MANFNRDLTETLAIESFLNADSPLGFGNQAQFVLLNPANIFGGLDSVPLFNQNNLGSKNEGDHPLHNFAVSGQESESSANFFDPDGQEASVGANFFDPFGDQYDDGWGLNFDRPLSEILAVTDAVDIQGDFVRAVIETLVLQGRVGAAKGLFFREELSDIVTANNEIRQLLDTPGTGEIAASERLSTGALKFLRYVPGTTPGTPNTIDLGALPTNVGSQGWVFDDTPQGVFLRGDWEARIMVSDSSATGSVRVSVNMFVVTADITSVTKIVQIGPTKTSSPFSPAVAPAQLIFAWPYGEVGEIFVDTNQYLYIEVILEELAHPSSTAYAKMRLDDLPHTLFSEFRTPGISPETTYYAAPADETLSIADALAFVVGYNRTLAESLSIADSLAQNVALQRTLAESISISDLIFAAKNVLYETLAISDSMDRMVAYQRGLSETLAIVDAVSVGALAPNYILTENLNVQDFVSFSITRPERPLKIGGHNRRPLHPIKQSKFKGLK